MDINNFSCTIDTPDWRQLDLRFVVNKNENKMQAVKSGGKNDHVCLLEDRLVIQSEMEGALVDHFIYLCKADDVGTKMEAFPSCFRILNLGTGYTAYRSWDIEFQLGSDQNRTLSDTDLIDVLIQKHSNKHSHSDVDEKYGKVFHHTHKWGDDDYASFHYVERQDKHLFVIGIGHHIGGDNKSYRFLDNHWTQPLLEIYNGKGNGKPKLIFENPDGSVDLYFPESLKYQARLKKYENSLR